MTPAQLSRRLFLQGLAAGSLVVAVRVSGPCALALVDLETEAALPFEPDVFVSIAPDGWVAIVAHRSEMGTGIRTALPMIVADELGADWERVRIEQAIGDAEYGSQNTDGSRSVRRFYERMRIAGATARTMLERAAAARWGVDATDCAARNHEIVHKPTGRSVGFDELVTAAAALEAPAREELRMKPASERRYVGRDIPIVDLDAIVTGRAVFGTDARRKGQLYAVVARSPALGGRVRSVDAAKAKAITGVVDVIEIPPFKAPHAFQALGGVAVIAKSTWAALQGRRALVIEWEDGENARFDSTSYERALVQAARESGKTLRDEGDVDAAFSEAKDIFEADYYVPHLAHASMEPPCAVAEVTTESDGTVARCDVWAPTQNPQAAQTEVARTLGIQPANVTVNVTLLGGGFGRKSKPDFIAEAAYLARRLKRPVHVTWTREDDLQHDYYHAVAAVHMRAALDGAGRPQGWLQRSAFPPITSTFVRGARYGSAGEMGLGFTDLPYSVPNLRIENGPAEAHLRIGWLRSVAHIYHAFAVCSFPDELAHRAGRDPFEYLMELLGEPRFVGLEGVEYPNHGEPLARYPIDVGRLRHVTERAAELAGWGRALARGRGLGIACHRSFLSYAANVVEVEVGSDGAITIPRVHVVIDAGLVINPDRVRAQMEGATVFGASLALYGEITAENGRVQQSNFHNYRIARIYDAPREVNVEIVASEALPAGVGEVGVPPFAPALCNAIFAATGKRIRRLPIARHDLSS